MRQRTKLLSILTAALLAVSAMPAVAGPAETAFLQKLTANWVGKGKLVGAQSGPVACRIVITAGGQSAKYQGRCTIPDMASQAFNGAISYNDKTRRYEIRSISGTVPGVKRGNSLVFTTKDTSAAGSSYSTMTLSPASLSVNFTIIDRHGEKTTSHITFSK
ncbi:MAG: hypothetical protein BGO82_15335 [Devosia sp. 67-54]|uniref:hypothetical protein n=1 Tax=unclassified Devosia TaxID=196773 RepID=UPI00095CB86B|nr:MULTISPECIES: hypothetical protein [unclassified Devosia]MBN9303742.1 hypothetical protein [Devosia sp.]OJX17615.1 MAG: hypothetical protein BGO82_15335 [Devosia sp. 67-54]